MLYIQFGFTSPEKLKAFEQVYNLLCENKPLEKSKPLEYWNQLIPDDVKNFLAAYHQEENSRHYLVNESFKSMINYLEFGLEVDFEGLELMNEHTARLSFSAYAFPYGGMERLLYFLRAYGFTPQESYNGFSVISFEWATDSFDYDVTELSKKTQEYLAQFDR